MANKPGTANFFPDVPEFPSMGTFQPVYGKFDLTTYIQGASDYEIMAFLVGKYNACLEAYGNITKLSTDTITACKQLQDWINSWFDNLDVQEELNKKIDSMVQDGTFEALLHKTFDAQINQQTTSAVTTWLVANVTPTGSAVVVDKSLSIKGAAADAKETGKALIGSINVYNASSATNYSDLNTVPCNRVILFTNRNTYKLANAPTDNDGLFYSVTLNNNTSDQQSSVIQYYIVNVSNEPNTIYFRTKWGASWSNWTNYQHDINNIESKAILGSINVYNASSATNYSDLNTVPCNRVILFTNRNTYKLANAPTDNDGLFYSVARDVDDSTGYAQFYITTANMWRRVKWGATFRSWISMDSAQPISADYMPSSIAQFIKIGVVGDSYASGEIVLPPDYNFIDYYNLSWGQCIARRNGITCTNYSKGGLSTRSWLTSEKGQTLLTSSAPDNLYLLALGINDANNLGLDYLGSIEDIKSDYTQNADTFYGNYGKIISIIMAKSSTAKLVMLDLANDNNSDLYNTYNTAIKEIAKHFGIPYIHENDDSFFNSAFYKDKSYGHPTATTYGGMAVAIERLFAKCCVDNVNYFRNYIG